MGETIPDTLKCLIKQFIQYFKDVDNVSSPLNQRLSNLVFYNVYLGVY